MGRPPKLTQELITTICNAIRMGSYVETAVIYAGINKETFHNWVRKGNAKPSSIYGHFNDSVQKAWSESELRGVSDIDKAAKGEKDPTTGEWVLKPDWKATAWRLERQHAKHWSPKQTVKLEDNQTPADKSSFTDQDLHKILCDIINEDETSE